MQENRWGIDLSYEHKTACPRCRRKGNDRSGNNLHVYGEDSGAHCFACSFTIPSREHIEAMGWGIDEDELEEVMTQERITKEEAEKIRSYTGLSGKGTRGITDETYKFYGVRHKMDEATGQPVAQYYPITEKYEGTGYKVRTLPKTFSVIGKMSTESDLFGQYQFRNASGRYLLITAGEIDAMSGFQMLEDYRKSKGSDYEPTPVVSGILGEKSSAKQIQAQYDWINRFERIIYCPDNDEAGRESIEKVAKVVPKGKLYIMQLPLKDTNKMLEEKKEKAWVSAFYNAKPYTPDGILASSSVMDRIKEQALIPKIPLPPFMHKLQKMMAGGIPLGVIVNLASASGTGKSTIVDEMTYFWVFNSPHKIGVVTLESDAGQYGTKILSRHIGMKIDLIEDINEKIAFLESESVQAKANELWYNADGSSRWYLVEERDGGIESLKELIMNLIVACDCKVIILDPLQDILDGMGNEEQALFNRWMKGMIKSHGVTFINVNHVRKNNNNQKANSTGAELHEEDIHGSSTILKSGACNLLFTRNKEAEDEIERNTTYMKASKIRWTGDTGMAGEYYYDNKTHTLWDKSEWLAKNGMTEF